MPAEPDLEKNAAAGQTMCGVMGGTRLFQRFTLQKVLGHGSMGTVWLARDDRMNRLVALKLLPEAICFDDFAREELKHETQQNLVLTHPNIVPLYDFLEDEESAAIAMEFVDGATLSSVRLQKRARCFAVSEIAPWVASLCDALAYAHESAGLLHRDLKPSNLMVNSRREIEITDFGIAGTVRDCMSRLGGRPPRSTLSYTSPQQLLEEEPARTDDIYAVGATLYEMLSSKPPFYDGDIPAQIREVTPPWVAERREKLGIAGEEVPKYWEEAIAACLAKNPSDRPQTPIDLARRLRLGGTIRLAAAQQESKMRALLHALSHARIVGAAAGLAALIAAAVLGLRSSHPLSAVKQSANAILPNGFAMELFRSEPAPDRTTIVPDPNSLAPVGSPATSVLAEQKNAALQLSTTPAGANFAVYPGVILGKTTPAVPALHEGTAPQSIGDLPPGHYTVFFRNEGWPEERAEVSLEEGETLPVDYTFPHGRADITSVPEGAEIFLGSRSLGHAPLTVDLPLGKQQLTAKYPDRPERSQTVTIESDTSAAVAFKLTQNQSPGRVKAKPPDSAFGKLGQSLKKVFSRKTPPKRTKS